MEQLPRTSVLPGGVCSSGFIGLTGF